MRTMTLFIDHLPDRKLSPNARTHWGTKSGAVNVAKKETAILARKYWVGEPTQKARIDYVFKARTRRKRDYDNLLAMCKPWQDGLIIGGAIMEDDTDHLEIGSMRLIYAKHDGVEITVTEIN